MNKWLKRHRIGSNHGKSIWRFLWLLLLVLHAPATFEVVSAVLGSNTGETRWSSAILITATNLFFILEILFAWSLHLLSNRRSAIAFLLIVAMVHVGAIDRAVPELNLPANLRLWTALAAGTAITVRLLAPLRAAFMRVMAGRSSEARLRQRRRYGEAFDLIMRPTGAARLSRCLPERGPPLI